MLFAIICQDKPGALETRLAVRPKHLEYLEAIGDKLKCGGAFLNDTGEPEGSLIVIEAEDLAAARAFADGDPFVAAGVFETTEVRPWRAAVGAWVA